MLDLPLYQFLMLLLDVVLLLSVVLGHKLMNVLREFFANYSSEGVKTT